MIHGHGDDRYKYDRPIRIDFSSNIFRHGNHGKLARHLCSQMECMQGYPEPDAAGIAEILAKKQGLSAEKYGITNGATEAIYLIAQTFRGYRSSIIAPTFSEYQDACRIHDHGIHFIKSPEDIDSRIQMVWLCNPNNPTGTVTDKEEIERMLQKHPGVVFVMDHSYAAFTSKKILTDPEAAKYENVILLHSLTKRFSIPGLRIGYYFTSERLNRMISARRMPWSVNAFAIEAARFLLQNKEYDPLFPLLREASAGLCRKLSALRDKKGEQIIECFPADTHFFLCRLKKGTAPELKQYLAENHGILIRDASNFETLDKTWFRVAAQMPEENEILVNALKEWIGGIPETENKQ